MFILSISKMVATNAKVLINEKTMDLESEYAVRLKSTSLRAQRAGGPAVCVLSGSHFG